MSIISLDSSVKEKDTIWVSILKDNLENYKPLLPQQLKKTRRKTKTKKTKHMKQNNQREFIIISSSEDEESQTTVIQVIQPKVLFSDLNLDKNQIIGEQYKIIKVLGQGAFGKVVEVQKGGKLYAIKILKDNSKSMLFAHEEIQIIQELNRKDPKDQYGIVRYIQSFIQKEHYFIVFQSLGRNLYEVMVNNKTGYNIKLVQSFFKQILVSIGFIHKSGYTHTDLKPQNILLVDKQFHTKLRNPKSQEGELLIQPVSSKIKIIDFGNSVHQKKHHSNLINTRQYRAPQVILNCCRWNHSSDVWGIGCIIIQLLFGRLAFSPKQNHQHLYMMQMFCGKFPSWMYNRSQKFSNLFQNGKVIAPEYIKDKKNRLDQLIRNKQALSRYPEFYDLLFKCLEIDPRKRISCEQALNHQFFLIEHL